MQGFYLQRVLRSAILQPGVLYPEVLRSGLLGLSVLQLGVLLPEVLRSRV